MTWTALPVPLGLLSDFTTVTQLGDLVVRICGPDCGQVEVSTDLASWTVGPLPGGGRYGAGLIGFGGKLYVIGANQANVMRSDDGLAWTSIGSYPNIALTSVAQFTPP